MGIEYLLSDSNFKENEKAMKHSKKLIFALIISLVIPGAKAQQNTVSGGGVYNNANGSVTFSLGQIDYRSQTSNGGTITQGLQQPYEIFTTGILSNQKQLNFSVFPNPATDRITIESSEPLVYEIHFELFDVKGKMLEKSKITQQSSSLDLSQFAVGIYFLTIRNNKSAIKNFKIIKN